MSNGPIIDSNFNNAACQPRFDSDSEETTASDTFVQGWFQVGGGDANLKKNIQVYAVSVPNSVLNNGNGGNPVISTAQYQQDRTFSRANLFGAWFRTDIEINPAGIFNWNGAIHTEGSLYVNGRGPFNGQLISQPQSCFFNPKLNSDITVGGHLLNARMTDNRVDNGAVNFEIYPNANDVTIAPATDSTNYAGNSNRFFPSILHRFCCKIYPWLEG